MTTPCLTMPNDRTEAEVRAVGHSPTPWVESRLDGIFSQQRADGGQNPLGFVYLPAFAERSAVGRQAMADRHFIVLAVNSYNAMKAALEAALPQIEAEAEQREHSGNGEYFQPMKDLVVQVRDAIALARGVKP